MDGRNHFFIFFHYQKSMLERNHFFIIKNQWSRGIIFSYFLLIKNQWPKGILFSYFYSSKTNGREESFTEKPVKHQYILQFTVERSFNRQKDICNSTAMNVCMRSMLFSESVPKNCRNFEKILSSIVFSVQFMCWWVISYHGNNCACFCTFPPLLIWWSVAYSNVTFLVRHIRSSAAAAQHHHGARRIGIITVGVRALETLHSICFSSN